MTQFRFSVRQERIQNLTKLIPRIENALKNWQYTGPNKHNLILADLAALENAKKELEIQLAYLLLES